MLTLYFKAKSGVEPKPKANEAFVLTNYTISPFYKLN